MANTLRDTFSDIADAIRAKGVTGTMTPLEMPTKIGSIAGGGSKYGLTMDNILGDVDQNGELQQPTGGAFSSTDIVSIPNRRLRYKFYEGAITSVSLPNLTTVGTFGMYNAFYGCRSLTSVDLSSLPSVNSVNAMNSAFYGCTSLTNVDLSSLSSVTGSGALGNAFNDCTALQEVKFNNATAIPAISTNTFQNTNSTFKIIVPDALYSQWKTATNWSTYANQIVKVSDYTPAS